jgi:predicted DNA repair protein MutK
LRTVSFREIIIGISKRLILPKLKPELIMILLYVGGRPNYLHFKAATMYFWYGRAFQEKNHTGIDVSFNKI